jgi:lipopolysaccharide transport system ATP-binding protein
MAAIRALCPRAILLDRGSIAVDGSTDRVVSQYLDGMDASSLVRIGDRQDRGGSGLLRVADIEIWNGDGERDGALRVGAPARFQFRLNRQSTNADVVFTLYDRYGHLVTDFDSRVMGAEDQFGQAPHSALACTVDCLALVPQRYRMNVALLADGVIVDHVEGAAVIDVVEGTMAGRFTRDGTRGTTVIAHRWSRL